MAHVTKDGVDSSSRAFRSTRVVTPSGVRPATILIRGEHIEAVTEWDDIPPRWHAFARLPGDLVLLPRPRRPPTSTSIRRVLKSATGKPNRTSTGKGFATATRAAAAGGVTTLVDMPLNCVPETISAAALEAKRAAAAGQSYVDWMTWGGAVGNNGIGGNEPDLTALIATGVPGFKCFLVHCGLDGFAWIDEPQLRKTLAAMQGSGLPLLAHAELAGPVECATVAINVTSESPPTLALVPKPYLASRPGRSGAQRSNRTPDRLRTGI